MTVYNLQYLILLVFIVINSTRIYSIRKKCAKLEHEIYLRDMKLKEKVFEILTEVLDEED